MHKGFVQVYTGNGKGKTTAAIGLAVRAAGAGLRVYFAQFIKQQKCSEHTALERFRDLIEVKQFGAGLIIGRKPSEEDRRIAREGYDEIGRVLRAQAYDMVILDEVNIAVHQGLISVDELLSLIKNRPEGLEMVLTGRYADQKIMDAADLVTEMREIRHYHQQGVEARRGIEK